MACCYEEVRNYEKVLFIKAGFFKLSVHRYPWTIFGFTGVLPKVYHVLDYYIFTAQKEDTFFKVIASAEVQFFTKIK